MEKKIITKEEIEEILQKYNIGKKPLSLVLGWGEVTIIRYLSGQIPDQIHSDILYKIKSDTNLFLSYLEQNKELITNIAYKKVIAKITETQLEEDKSRIYLVAKHIIAKMGDTTPLALQKILYYIEGFSLALLNKNIFETSCEAWLHGPVYRDIYNRFSYYSYHPIEFESFKEYLSLENMDAKEVELIDKVITCFGCYSGKILENMTHLTTPWLRAREGIEKEETSKNIISEKEMVTFFKNVCKEYNIVSIQDISKYSKKMFQKLAR